jgi:hypothetical protein
MTSNDPTDAMTLPQGDLALLHTSLARRLLASTIPARFAYVALDGTPRIVPTWFEWTGHELVMPTFIAAPHIRHSAARVRALRKRPAVAVTIDTERFPPEALSIRGDASVSEVHGVDPDYASAARRYLGDEGAVRYLAQIDQPGTVMARIAVLPEWVGLVDFTTRMPSALGGIAPG